MPRILVLGGARSGKSTWAEQLLLDADEVDYVATSPAMEDDPEWQRRIALHRERRPAHWNTWETPDLPRMLREPGPAVLVDCLGMWLTGVCDELNVWEAETPDEAELERRIDELVDAWRFSDRYLVAVSNEVGMGIVPADAGTRLYRDWLGRLNMKMAAASDEVYLLVAGLASRLK